MRNRKGFTLVEALIGIGILEVGIFAAVFLTQKISEMNRSTDDDLSYLTVRNQILVTITDPRIWAYTMKGPLNPDLSCWINQDQIALAPRNCGAKTGELVVYNIKEGEEFNFSSPTDGLTPAGEKCTTFVPPPGDPNPSCPMGVSLRWTAACEATDAECVNPPIKIDGIFTFNGVKSQRAPPSHRLNFSTYRLLRFCPVQAASVLQDSGVAPGVTIGGANQVISNETGQVTTTGYGVMSKEFIPCRTVSINFQEDMDSAPVSPLLKADPENQSQVCIFDATTNTCRFEVIRKVIGTLNTLVLRSEGVDVFQVPDAANITSSSRMNFRVTRNLAELLIDGKVYFTWPNKVTFPMQVRFKPASKSYSPSGFNAVAVTTAN